LPALPSAWPNGSVSGLMAQEAFEVTIHWDQNTLTEATIKSKQGAACSVKNSQLTGNVTVTSVSNNQQLSYATIGDTIGFNTTTGES